MEHLVSAYLSGVTISGNTINETGKPANDNI